MKPRRFDVRLSLRGKVWRRIQVEIAPEEGSALENDVFPAAAAIGRPELTMEAAVAELNAWIASIEAAT